MTATKILLISNCQVQPLKHGLGAVCKNVDIEAVPVHIIPSEKRQKVFAQHVAKKDSYDLVLSIHLSTEFDSVSYDRIVEIFHPTRVVTISNLYFNGLHPDIAYIGGLSARTPGPIGDYHSQIALLGYIMGWSATDTVRLYCDKVYEAMGYYDLYRASLEEMKVRDTHTNIAIGDLLEASLNQGVGFLSQNHPTSVIMAPYINKIAKWLADNGLVEHSGLELRPEEIVNYLAFSSIFPIYPEVAARHGMPYPGSYIFRTPTIGDVPSSPLSLIEFVTGEHQAFDNADQRILREQYPGNLLNFKYVQDPAFRQLISELAF